MMFPSKVFVARGGVAELTNTILSAEEVQDLVERMLKTSGRRVDLSSPVDGAVGLSTVTGPDLERRSRARTPSPWGHLRRVIHRL